MNKNQRSWLEDVLGASQCGGCDKCSQEPDETDQGLEYFETILVEALQQVTGGKGEERHGHGKQLFDQPWLAIANAAGNGFLTGQAVKKLMEAASLRDKEGYSRDQFERELLGAIVYTAFAILHQRISDDEEAH